MTLWLAVNSCVKFTHPKRAFKARQGWGKGAAARRESRESGKARGELVTFY